jgi:hypothetical protein
MKKESRRVEGGGFGAEFFMNRFKYSKIESKRVSGGQLGIEFCCASDGSLRKKIFFRGRRALG